MQKTVHYTRHAEGHCRRAEQHGIAFGVARGADAPADHVVEAVGAGRPPRGGQEQWQGRRRRPCRRPGRQAAAEGAGDGPAADGVRLGEAGERQAQEGGGAAAPGDRGVQRAAGGRGAGAAGRAAGGQAAAAGRPAAGGVERGRGADEHADGRAGADGAVSAGPPGIEHWATPSAQDHRPMPAAAAAAAAAAIAICLGLCPLASARCSPVSAPAPAKNRPSIKATGPPPLALPPKRPQMLLQLGLNGSSRGALRSVAVARASRAVLGRRLESHTVRTSFAKEHEILVAQRSNRPVSPHLTIYQPQLTWYLSSLHRLTGVFLGLGFFAVTMAFGVSTLFGLGLTTDKLQAYYRDKVPRWADWTLKGSAAYMFAFHFGNGIRHLVWDTGKELSIKGVNKTGIAVLALTAVGGTALLFK